MGETTKTGQEYYVGKRKQVPDKQQRGPTYENATQEFECMTGYKVKDPEIV